MEEPIVNRVATSSLITFDLEEYYDHGERVVYDLEQNLFQGMVIREKDFRAFVKEHDWSQFQGKNVAIHCSADAIVPTWAYMLLASKLEPFANMVAFGSLEDLEDALYREALASVDPSEFQDSKVIIKGCSKYPVPESAYVEITRKLRPYVASLMYGEACSAVPLYKRK